MTLAEHQLTTGLHVKHTGPSTTAPFEFQALFHNYIRAPANDVRISPLAGVSYYDKTEATEDARAAPKLEARAGVDVNKFTDSVYEDAGGRYDVVWPSGAIEVRATNLKDVVVWNPQQEAGSKIGDMEAGGWCVLENLYKIRVRSTRVFFRKHREKYVCVEPGYVRGFVKIEPGQTWSGQQVLSVKV